MSTLQAWQKEWRRDADDPCVLKPYLLPSEDLESPTVAGPKFQTQTVRVWVGPAVDCVRLDCVNLSMYAKPGDVPVVYMEVRACSGALGVGYLWADGHWPINGKDPTGFLVQCEGIITDGIEIKLATDAASWSGAPIRIGIRALVVRRGGPVAVTRGLLLP